jgi:hypothetical protein
MHSTSHSIPSTYALTQHALDRMDARRLSSDAVRHVLQYGRSTWTRGARVFAIGRKEVAHYRRRYGIDLTRYEGIHVVTTAEGAILTVYRNHDLRGLRRDKRPAYSTEHTKAHRGQAVA